MYISRAVVPTVYSYFIVKFNSKVNTSKSVVKSINTFTTISDPNFNDSCTVLLLLQI